MHIHFFPTAHTHFDRLAHGIDTTVKTELWKSFRHYQNFKSESSMRKLNWNRHKNADGRENEWKIKPKWKHTNAAHKKCCKDEIRESKLFGKWFRWKRISKFSNRDNVHIAQAILTMIACKRLLNCRKWYFSDGAHRAPTMANWIKGKLAFVFRMNREWRLRFHFSIKSEKEMKKVRTYNWRYELVDDNFIIRVIYASSEPRIYEPPFIINYIFCSNFNQIFFAWLFFQRLMMKKWCERNEFERIQMTLIFGCVTFDCQSMWWKWWGQSYDVKSTFYLLLQNTNGQNLLKWHMQVAPDSESQMKRSWTPSRNQQTWNRPEVENV